MNKFIGGDEEAKAWIEAMKGPLSFVGDFQTTPLHDHFGVELQVPVKTPGAYILVARDGVAFKYPRGDSPVYYIGMSNRLRNRVRMHRENIRKAREHREFSIYPPLAEYGCAYGEYFSIVTTEVTGINPAELEMRLMARFAKRYGSLPVANSSANWKMIRAMIDLDNSGTNNQV